jgi:WhiB family redox-sensing transcriptional regulator
VTWSSSRSPSEANIRAAADDSRFVAAVDRVPALEGRDRAACRNEDVNVFYDDVRLQTSTVELFCDACPVVTDCLASALLGNERLGVWGGTTEVERKPMLTAAYRRRKLGVA